MGEREFPKTPEGENDNITTIYDELLLLKKLNSNIIDLTIPIIYNNLNYENYKNDLSLINKANYNVCFGQGGQLCSSLIFGKTIFFNPIEEINFFKNINLYNSGHRYFKRIEMMFKYLLEVL